VEETPPFIYLKPEKTSFALRFALRANKKITPKARKNF
jgi:hypothetical protein